MTENNEIKALIGEILGEIVEEAKEGGGRKTKVGLMAYGSELGQEELCKGARLAMHNDPAIKVFCIGPKLEGYEDLDWIETPADEHAIAAAMEDALNDGIIEGAVALHYPFPVGVTTIGKVFTPGKGKPCYVASSTGTTSPVRTEAMLRNAIYGIAVAKSDGVPNPTVGVLNLDGAQTVLRALQKLAIVENVADAAFQFGDRDFSSVHWRMLKNRLGRAFSTQVQGLNSDAPGFHDKRMICALPTRFSAGTKPTPISAGTRLSSELSRLSPMKK